MAAKFTKSKILHFINEIKYFLEDIKNDTLKNKLEESANCMINILKTSDEGLDNMILEFGFSIQSLIRIKNSLIHVIRDVDTFLNNQEGEENEANIIKGIAENVIADLDNSNSIPHGRGRFD